LQSKIFINFTPTSIYDPKNCLQTTLRAVDESTLSREQIVFEVIESENVADPNHLRDILDFYREQGFQVALDDVGSGYSSLNMISRLRPDFMKLDRELVSGLHQDNYKAMIAKKLLETAQELGVHTIAEGVEEEGEFEWLCENGADFVQGYFIARPASPPPVLVQSNPGHIAVTA
jgi:EAL domain-containing protein (putative c-di-GMP-specific phosphodiesterase class I)